MKRPVDFPDHVDTVVIGGGTGGCVMASRLSETGETVLLLEAGCDTPPNAVPADILDRFPRAVGNSEYFWPGLMAELFPGDQGSCGRSVPFPQARVLGGGSSINGMVALRGLPRDYDEWRDIGLPGWGWEDVLPFFRKIESDQDFNGPLHGEDGPFPVRRIPRSRWGPFSVAAVEALRSSGVASVDDLNADFDDGVGPLPINALPDGRVSAARAYLSAAIRARPNLHIVTRATAEKIVFERRKVAGVCFSIAGVDHMVAARRVILCAGAIHSPALLLKSGIGPAADVARVGLSPVCDLPGVGANLINHASVTVATFLPARARQARDLVEWPQSLWRYSSGMADCSASDMNLVVVNKTAAHPLGRHIGAASAHLCKTYSTGRVSLERATRACRPKIEFNLLGDDRDLLRLADGLRRCLELLADCSAVVEGMFLPNGRLTRHLGRPGKIAQIESAVIAGCFDMAPALRRAILNRWRPDVDLQAGGTEDLAALARAICVPTGHPVGTCRMGPVDDRDAVTDETCRVRGLEGIWVADASVMPTIISGNTNFPVAMIAEKIADAMTMDDRR